jgi:hypothetical protein
MKALINTITILLISLSSSFAQNTQLGKQVYETYENSRKIQFKKEYSQLGDSVFITTYKIFSQSSGNHIYTVTAEHFRNQKLIVVTNSEPEEGMFSNLGKIEVRIDYENPDLKPFGKLGVVRGINGSISPNLCLAQFVSSKYENVNIIEVQINSNNQMFFILDNKK